MARNRYMVGLVFLTFFVMSLLTNILGPIVPDIISSFGVSLTAAALLPFSFFIAYGVMSIPAGFWVERFTEKPVMIAAFLAGTVGSLSFALFPTYHVAVGSLFLMGAGMATLQVAINPLLRVAGGEEHFAFNSAFAQFIFGTASFASPRIYSYLVENLGKPSAQGNLLLETLGQAHSARAPLGLDVLDLCGLHCADDCRARVHARPSGRTHERRSRRFSRDVWQPSSQADGVGVFPVCLRLRGMRAGNRRLDVKVSRPVSRLRSAYDRCDRRFLVLGNAHRRMFRGHGTAQAV